MNKVLEKMLTCGFKYLVFVLIFDTYNMKLSSLIYAMIFVM